MARGRGGASASWVPPTGSCPSHSLQPTWQGPAQTVYPGSVIHSGFSPVPSHGNAELGFSGDQASPRSPAELLTGRDTAGAPAIHDMTRVSGARCQEPGQRPICTNCVISWSFPSLFHGHCHAGAGDWGLCRQCPPGAHSAAYPGLGLGLFPFAANNQQRCDDQSGTSFWQTCVHGFVECVGQRARWACPAVLLRGPAFTRG